MRYLFLIIVFVVTAGAVWSGMRIRALEVDLETSHHDLKITVAESSELRAEVRELLIENHPFATTGVLGPSASLELQCAQFKGLLPKSPGTKAD